jgi:signal transduction histidine kinase
VTASTDDRLWNEEEAALDFIIAPAWYQTYSFFALCIVTGGVALWALYRLRMYQLARALGVRFDERLAERTRVARDIHDTLLQTVQGSKLVADDALDRSEDLIEMRSAMEQVSHWLGQASREGRAAVNALRATTTDQNDLADALRRAVEDCRRQSSMQASLSVNGEPRDIHPVVRDDVYRIGYEAIRNACKHSRGSRLEVDLHYGHDLTLLVADDGVGIDSKVAETGKDGHFGLQGMRERAARIGATLTIASTATTGTEIVVVIPGHAIFRRGASTLFDTVLARLRKTSTKI